MDQLQFELRRKSRLLEQLSSTDLKHQAQLQSMEENLKSANTELSEEAAEVSMIRSSYTAVNNAVNKIDI